jgi:hypothetical protein
MVDLAEVANKGATKAAAGLWLVVRAEFVPVRELASSRHRLAARATAILRRQATAGVLM